MNIPRRTTFAGALPAVAVLAGLLCADSPAAITKGPYLQSPGRNSVTVMWECSDGESAAPAETTPDAAAVSFRPADQAAGRVRYGKTPDLGSEAEAGAVEVRYLDRGDPETEPVGRTAYLFTCRLDGLEPGTPYYYRVGAGRDESALSRFTTVPEKADRFRFVAYTDSHAGENGNFARINALVKEEDPAFILHSGDIVNSGDKVYAEWGSFFAAAADVMDHVPLWPTVGNHDMIGGCETYPAVFSLPGAEFYYSFDYGNAHFVSLNSYPGQDGPEMLTWCEQDLANSTAFWKIVFLHEPVFATHSYPCKWGWRDFVPLFERHGVNLCLSGHLHVYERMVPLHRPGGDPASAVTYIVNGETAGKLRDAPPHPAIACATSRVSTYTVFDIDGATLSARVVDLDGQTVDRFSIRRNPDGSYDETYVASACNARSMMLKELFPKGYMADLPSQTEAAEIAFDISAAGLGLAEPIELEIGLAGESQPHYALQPEVVRATLDPATRLPLRLAILCRQNVEVARNGRWPEPVILVEFRFRTSYHSGSAVSRVALVEKKWW